MHARRSITPAVTIALALAVGSPGRLTAQGTGATSSVGAIDVADEGWSFDDIKDVFEAVHFLAITVGIGVGVWWFASRYLGQGAILAVDLDVGDLTSIDGGERSVVEVVAVIRNDGVTVARIRRCLLSVAAIDSTGAAPMGILRDGAGLRLHFEGEFPSSATTVAAGACVRLTAVVAIPRDAEACLLTARIESIANRHPVISSRLKSFGARAKTPA